jgi:hypothetical protein
LAICVKRFSETVHATYVYGDYTLTSEGLNRRQLTTDIRIGYRDHVVGSRCNDAQGIGGARHRQQKALASFTRFIL